MFGSASIGESRTVMPLLSSPPRLIGLQCIFLSAGGFGAMPIFARFAYADGVDLPSMLFLRFALAGASMAVIMVARGSQWPRGRNLWLLVAMGALGYAGQAFCYFGAHGKQTPMRQAPAPDKGGQKGHYYRVKVLGALVGTGLAVGGSLTGNLPGIILGIGAALIYSIYILVGERVTKTEGAIASGTVVMLSAGVVYGLLVLWRGPSWPSSFGGWAAVGSIALLSTLLAIVAFFAAMQRLGAADAATFSTLEPIVTVILAALFLRERINAWQAVGGALILCTVIFLARSGETG